MKNSADLQRFFDERLAEVVAYVDLLGELEEAAQRGAPRLEGAQTRITATQQKILYSGVYLQLYNLVEATISQCVDTVTAASAEGNRWRPEDLNESLRSEWIRATARTHVELNPKNRLESAIRLSAHLVDRLPIDQFEIEVGGGGNWDDESIERVSVRLGCALTISAASRKGAKVPRRDGLSALKLVRNRRNRLAHGAISFVDCADGVTVSELQALVTATGAYLQETVHAFVNYVDTFQFLVPASQPAVAP